MAMRWAASKDVSLFNMYDVDNYFFNRKLIPNSIYFRWMPFSRRIILLSNAIDLFRTTQHPFITLTQWMTLRFIPSMYSLWRQLVPMERSVSGTKTSAWSWNHQIQWDNRSPNAASTRTAKFLRMPLVTIGQRAMNTTIHRKSRKLSCVHATMISNREANETTKLVAGNVRIILLTKYFFYVSLSIFVLSFWN